MPSMKRTAFGSTKKPKVYNQQARAAVFLDRDGIINPDTGYAFRPDDAELEIGVALGLSTLKKMGFLLPVITNQSGVARGYYSLYDVFAFNQKLNFILQKEAQISLDGFYICPHFSGGIIPQYKAECLCRKPKTALIEMARDEFNIDLTRSFFIGDKVSDAQCAHNASISPILVTKEKKLPSLDFACAIFSSLKDAVKYIKKNTQI